MTKKKKSGAKLTLWGGTALTMNAKASIVENALIEIEGDTIVSVASQKKPTRPKGKSIDCRGCLITPGFINTHTHTGMTLLKGIGGDLPFDEWLFKKILPLEKKWADAKFVYFGTLLACAEMICNGITLFNDMYYLEDMAAKAVDETGMRAICGQTMFDIGGVEKAEAILDKFDAFLKKIKPYKNVIGAIAPHSLYGVSESAWPELIAYAGKHNLLMHIHLCESEGETIECQKRFGKTQTEVFDRIGLWKHKPVICAHAVELTDNDIKILGRNQVGISHNPESNLKLGNKICRVKELRAAGARVGLGTDGTSSNNNLDILAEGSLAARLQTYRSGIGSLTALDTVRMLTCEGAAALGLGDKTGSLEPGKWADLAVISTATPQAQPLYDPYSFLVYSASSADVLHTVVGGRVLMQDRKLKTLNEKKLLEEARRWGAKIANSSDSID
jgi:5-methylthioadenosine/S-adenosylhomocysteine deaminase